MLKQLTVLMVFSICGAMAQVTPRVMQKAEKAMIKFYDSDKVTKEYITLSNEHNDNTPSQFHNDNFFRILIDGNHLGFGYIGNAPSKTATFDYLVLFDTDFILTKSMVLIYREEYGGEIGSKRWLRQFEGGTVNSDFAYRKDIIPISGATISVQSMTLAINDLLKSLRILKELKAI